MIEWTVAILMKIKGLLAFQESKFIFSKIRKLTNLVHISQWKLKFENSNNFQILLDVSVKS